MPTRQASGQKQRSFSNDARIILQGNNLPHSAHKQAVLNEFTGNPSARRGVGNSYSNYDMGNPF